MIIGIVETFNTDADIDFHQLNSARIRYSPTKARQRQYGPSMVGQFVVQYDVERNMNAGEFLVCDGYFVHLFAPTGLPPIPKNILFMLDKSGSMLGTKIQQLKVMIIKIYFFYLKMSAFFRVLLLLDSVRSTNFTFAVCKSNIMMC